MLSSPPRRQFGIPSICRVPTTWSWLPDVTLWDCLFPRWAALAAAAPGSATRNHTDTTIGDSFKLHPCPRDRPLGL